MRARGKGVGISFKIALIFMILSGAFWIILFIQFYYSSDQEAKEYVESLSEQAMSSISKNIEMIIGNVSFHSRQILSNGDLIHSLKEEQPEQQQKYLYEFISLTDFESYMNVSSKIRADYENKIEWQKKALYNIAGAGFFSSDRSIVDYAENIWEIYPVD